MHGSQAEIAEIQNLKEVLHQNTGTLQRTRRYGNSAMTSKQKDGGGGDYSPVKGGGRSTAQLTMGFDLPEDAAQRWMSNA